MVAAPQSFHSLITSHYALHARQSRPWQLQQTAEVTTELLFAPWSFRALRMKCARMKHALFLVGLVAITALTDAFGQSATFSIQTYPILGNTHVAADFNGDGKLDLAAPGVTGAALMLNNGNGTFTPKTEFPLINYPQGIAAGDFNGDGKQDLAVVLQNAQFSMAVLLGTGAGGF